MVMTTAADIGFVEMRLSKVAGISVGEDRPSFCVVLDAVSEDRHLPIMIGQAEALTLSASLTGTEFPRPMGPQFAAGLLHALGGRVRQVRIDRLVPVRDGTAYGSTVKALRVSSLWTPGRATR
jgi:bifunctional DNase/RNase